MHVDVDLRPSGFHSVDEFLNLFVIHHVAIVTRTRDTAPDHGSGLAALAVDLGEPRVRDPRHDPRRRTR